MSIEKKVLYTTSNTYHTLNSFSSTTKNVWLVFHGMGYLSRYFIRYFSELSSEENFIIAPQAPAKYYMGEKFKHVGASWLTRENTIEDTKNIFNYMDTVFETEKPETMPNFIVLDYLNRDTKVTYLYGDKDQYITEARKTEESLKGAKLFGDRLKVVVFDGIHEVNKDFIKKISQV